MIVQVDPPPNHSHKDEGPKIIINSEWAYFCREKIWYHRHKTSSSYYAKGHGTSSAVGRTGICHKCNEKLPAPYKMLGLLQKIK